MIQRDEKLESGSVILRPLVENDYLSLYPILSDQETMTFWSTGPHSSPEKTREDLAKHLNQSKTHSESTWAICLNQQVDICSGWISFFNFRHAMCEVGFVLDRKFWGRKIMTHTLQTAISDGFNRWNLHRIDANLHPENTGSKNLLLRTGFSIEGHQKQNYYKNGVYEDTLLMGLLRSDLPTSL